MPSAGARAGHSNGCGLTRSCWESPPMAPRGLNISRPIIALGGMACLHTALRPALLSAAAFFSFFLRMTSAPTRRRPSIWKRNDGLVSRTRLTKCVAPPSPLQAAERGLCRAYVARCLHGSIVATSSTQFAMGSRSALTWSKPEARSAKDASPDRCRSSGAGDFARGGGRRRRLFREGGLPRSPVSAKVADSLGQGDS
jgi:hypothetical protein